MAFSILHNVWQAPIQPKIQIEKWHKTPKHIEFPVLQASNENI